ncbi:hypothetical protein [Parabacteroides sp.]
MKEYVAKDDKISRTLINNAPRGKNTFCDNRDLNRISDISDGRVVYPVVQMTKRKRWKSNKSKPRRTKTVVEPAKFSRVEHYMHKLPQALDLITSARRQRMLITSTVTRFCLHRFKDGQLSTISIDNIDLLHPNSLKDSKTKKRYDIILRYLQNNKAINKLSDEIIKNLIPSDEDIQIAKVDVDRYVSLQGVGRIVAIQQAANKLKRKIDIEVMMYDISNLRFIPGQLEAISQSYKVDESTISKIFGTLLMSGSILLTYLAGKQVYSLASWISSEIIKYMKTDK